MSIKKSGSFSRGKQSEYRFSEAIESMGMVCRKSSRNDDIYNHIDFYIEDSMTNDVIASVDVKGGNFMHTIWVELKNVRGDEGWLYGKASFIAFEIPEIGGFSCVLTKHLREYVEQNVSDEFTTKDKAHKKLYTRKDRDDVITSLTIDDLKEIKSYKVLEYSKEYRHPVTNERIMI